MGRKSRKGRLPFGKHYQGCKCCCDSESSCHRADRKYSLQEREAEIKEREQKREQEDYGADDPMDGRPSHTGY